jgi:phospholipid/cholesterol/gamma-HCH transport system substrate-binding protein
MQNWSFRAGLIETTGGFGLDYDMPHRGSKYSMELFDFRDDGNPRLRLVAEYRLWNIFYTQLRGEDLISDNSEQSFTLTAGLKFTDQDLTALIGLLAN